jgi:hypothetical protein
VKGVDSKTVVAGKDAVAGRARDGRRAQLRYGFNEVDAWWHLALGDKRHAIRRHLRRMGTEVVRIFVFDKPVPDPVHEWRNFAAYVDAILASGAVPMVTFAKFHPPYDERNLRIFCNRCADIVWGCLEQWGADRVRDWYWCIWNEPNNAAIGGELTFDQYRRIYERAADEICRLLAPHLGGRKARIGGPAVDSFQPFWLDWIARFIDEVDDPLVGFVSWHRYGDWRPAVAGASICADLKGAPEAPMGATYEAMLMAQIPGYEACARTVARMLAGRDIMNVCGEHNAIVHHDHHYVGGLNQKAFGAAYYVSTLIHLLRGGADLEMRWTATANDDAYGVLTMHGEPTAACLAKELFAHHVRHGDHVWFPNPPRQLANVDALVTRSQDGGRRSGIFVHTGRGQLVLTIDDWHPELSGCRTILRIDAGTGPRVVRERCDGTLRLEGYGVAVATSSDHDLLADGG